MAVGPGAPDPALPGSAGELLRLVRTGRARSRTDLVALTGSSRSTVSLRVDQLLRAGLVVENGHAGSTGGRPARLLGLARDAGCVLAVDLGVTSADVALADLAGGVIAEARAEVAVDDGPERVFAQLDALADQVLRSAGRTRSDLRAAGIGVPGPVEHVTGRLVHPPVMPGWHDVVVPQAFPYVDGPVLVDNDANVMAAGELGEHPGGGGDFLVVKIGTGIGCGIVLDGKVYRGTDGSAGDIGHVHVPDDRGVRCRCGNDSCLEALAGGAALARDAREAGLDVAEVRDLVDLVLRAEPVALALVRDAGRRIGEVLAQLVNFFNPERVVVTGGVSHAGNPLLAGIREAVYRRALPLAARDLDITISALGDRAGRVGAARMALDAYFEPARVDALLSSG